MTRRGLLGRLAFAIAAAGVVNLALALTTLHHDYVVVTLIVFCLAALVEAIASSMGSVHPVMWRSEQTNEDPTPAAEATLLRYQRLLERQRTSREPDTGLQRQLLTLAERRLEQAHGLSREGFPDEVQRRLGSLEIELMTTGRLSPSDVNRIIDRIEEL